MSEIPAIDGAKHFNYKVTSENKNYNYVWKKCISKTLAYDALPSSKRPLFERSCQEIRICYSKIFLKVDHNIDLRFCCTTKLDH